MFGKGMPHKTVSAGSAFLATQSRLLFSRCSCANSLKSTDSFDQKIKSNFGQALNLHKINKT